MTGRVEEFVEIIPDPVLLVGLVGETIKKSVRIVPGEKYPFTITNFRARKGTDIRLNLEKKEFSGKSGFLLEIENTRETPGRYIDYIYLTTDSEIQPKLTLRVRGIIQVSGNRRPSSLNGPPADPPGAPPYNRPYTSPYNPNAKADRSK